jgi:hypothetical protein
MAVKEIYVVSAHRILSHHTYIVGAFTKKHAALRCAEDHEAYRGGKYRCQVDVCIENGYEDDMDNYTKILRK